MSSNQDWLARQQRMVKCPRHGLHFDPKMSTGCVRCLKERAKIRTKRPPQFFIMLLCVLGIAVVLFRIFGPSLLPKDEAIESLDVSQQSADRQLDAEAYRPAIESFENALFRADATTRADLQVARGRIASAAEVMSDAIQQRDGDAAASREVSDLVDGIEGNNLTFDRLESLRDRWLRIRNRHLTGADWFYQPAGARQSTSVEARASVAEYRDIAFELSSLLREASSEVASLAGQDDRNQRWQELTVYLNDQLRDITERKPKRPRSGSDDRLLLAFQKLEKAFNTARSLGGSSSPPNDASRFDDALRLAEEALQGFDDVR